METARVRVVSHKIIPYNYADKNEKKRKDGEAVMVKAQGVFCVGADIGDHTISEMPVSVHFTIYPGHELLIHSGDHLKLTLEREEGVR